MDDGEDFFSDLEEIAKKYGLTSGIIVCALGMLRNVELAYYKYPREREYLYKQLKGPFEVVSLKGNLSFNNEKLVVHVHAVLADEEFNCFGGHLSKAEVNAILELFILVPRSRFVRRFDEKTGLKILHFK
jgi:predicted DNA-binding protein with PD1-like motif